MFDKFNHIKAEIRDLKTAQKIPSTIAAWTKDVQIDQVMESDARGNYTIYYFPEESEVAEEPITLLTNTLPGVYLKPYDPVTQTQTIRVDYTGSTAGFTLWVTSNRKMIAVQKSTDPAPPTPIVPPAPEPPTPDPEWTQVRAFNPANMGTDPGWCLRNCRLGFGIMTGMMASARADMNSQIQNGTFHTDVPPPANIAVPVYCESGTPNGHVVVWDHGKVWSDGKLITDGLSHWRTVYGWGELCDGRRVVKRT
jgi:hypothetical protein